ncbi:hypothetical protein [Methanobrevibacter sp.]
MNIKYDNSMYCTNPPTNITPTLLTDEEIIQEVILNHILEEKAYKDHLQNVDEKFRELNKKWEK